VKYIGGIDNMILNPSNDLERIKYAIQQLNICHDRINNEVKEGRELFDGSIEYSFIKRVTKNLIWGILKLTTMNISYNDFTIDEISIIKDL
jgi:hypothetical protein